MTDAGRAGVQLRTDLKLFWREPADLFFTALLPVIFLVLFTTIFGNERVEELGGIRTAQLQVPGFIALSIVSAAFVSLAITLVIKRERGILKRTRATPVPAWVVFAGLIGKCVVVGVVVTVVLMLIGGLAYDVSLPLAHLPALLAALVLGSAAFCCLGVGFTSLVGSEEAAPAMTNAATLPIFFISGVFIPEQQLPNWLATVGDVLPIKPLADALVTAFDPRVGGAGIEVGELAILGAWGAAGLAVAITTFRWTPRRERD